MLSLYRLPNSLPDEKIIKVIRRDLFILIKKVDILILLVLLPLFFFYAITLNLPDLLTGNISLPIIILIISAYFLFLWLFFLFSFIDYYLDFWIVTNERIIDVQQNGFFSRIISEQKLDKIQDVTSEVHGMMATLFHFGNVQVQTAGAKQKFNFEDVPYPNNVRDLLIKLSNNKKPT
ncbi:hypothetical protein CO115_04520 [Candidatus Falkowbacteria bacterium CG_4_9_14_3_um_filter_36_9]|uniref:YdbS-like PH domain-containing protein n=2 Tax=Candidatus Falkowiibacteriota TaxID=1752728 RepID=A0A1J4T6Q8_9BACT|nr:MAG: hypothetical protein AUJ27_01835 [Candidatus Falkowbacteria bacterium CG1_02_37_44]PIV52179.1 MAG: hypothetical protein COS18_00050 [Candidatus Falkowbacteria bacterium CG02_land_8_20_14_3_00_36_14]PJB18454.1 MAG: hypothetical protein CO115_04520 [Candidatus Falkowbacteria bacterium CG_4_9_14_3_um_filter_36_9]